MKCVALSGSAPGNSAISQHALDYGSPTATTTLQNVEQIILPR